MVCASSLFLVTSVVADDLLAKDLSIVQRQMADVKPARPAESGLSVRAWVDHENNRYQIGDKLVLNIQTNRDAYISVLDMGTTGKVSQIYPNRYQPEQLVKAGAVVSIPPVGADYDFRVGGATGTELIKVFASEVSTPLINETQLSQSGVFSVVEQDADMLAKDLNVELKQAHDGKAAVYQKVIRIGR
jgi:hypothetical protein